MLPNTPAKARNEPRRISKAKASCRRPVGDIRDTSFLFGFGVSTLHRTGKYGRKSGERVCGVSFAADGTASWDFVFEGKKIACGFVHGGVHTSAVLSRVSWDSDCKIFTAGLISPLGLLSGVVVSGILRCLWRPHGFISRLIPQFVDFGNLVGSVFGPLRPIWAPGAAGSEA